MTSPIYIAQNNLDSLNVLLNKIQSNDQKITPEELNVELYSLNLSGPYITERGRSDIQKEVELHKAQANTLVKILQHAHCPSDLQITINRTTEVGRYVVDGYRVRTPVIPIFKALASGRCQAKNLTVNLAGTGQSVELIYKNEMAILTKGLSTGRCPSNMTLNLGKLSATPIDCFQGGENRIGVSGISELKHVLYSPHCSLGLKIAYERHQFSATPYSNEWINYNGPLPISSDDIKLYDQFDERLKTYSVDNTLLYINDLQAIFQDKLNNEMRRLTTIKGKDYNQLSKEDQKRYDVISNLHKRIGDISALHAAKQYTSDRAYEWKCKYQVDITAAIKLSLDNPNLDKYTPFEKCCIKLLNILTSFPLAPIKYIATGSFFYSATGKTKETVEELLEVPSMYSK